MKNLLKKTVFFLLIIIVIVITILIVVKKNEKHNNELQLTTENYSLIYDDTWEINKQENNSIDLIHKKSKSSINILIIELEDDIKYKVLDEIFDSFLYNIKEQNNDYSLLNKEKTYFNDIDAYKLLYENDNYQDLVYIYKQGGRVVTITYEAPKEYFDILIDNANNIIKSFKLNEKKFDVLSHINLETSEITFSHSDEVLDLLGNEKNETYSENGYEVIFSIPENFTQTQLGNYNFESLKSGEYISLRRNIYSKNIYEYLDKDSSFNVYSMYNLNSYNESNVQINKFMDEPLTYIYKNSYLNNNIITENIELIFELDINHILRVQISSYGTSIPEELVKMIKIIEKK